MASILTTNFDTTKIFIGDNRYKTATYTNGTGSTVTLAKGTLLGRIFSTNKVTPHVSTATNGSEYPVGVLAEDYTVANGASVDVSFCYGGDINQGKLTLGGSDTLATVITRTYTDSGTDTVAVPMGTIEDLIVSRTHINLVASTENTGYDNQ